MRTILLIESQGLERTQLTSALQRAGYRILATESAAEVRNLVTRVPVDLAIVSNSLSDSMDIELVQWLRGHAAAASLPILAVSTDPSVHARLSTLAAGANDHVAWPFSTDHIIDRVQKLLNRRDHLPSVAPLGFARQVLVVDDSPTYGNALMDELQKDGHDVALAESGGDALRFLERQRADLVILDVFLPDINGVEVCRRIKSIARTSSIPVLMLTGREKSAIRAEAAAAHADDFIVKSRDLETIRSKVRRLLVKSSAGQLSSGQLPAVTLGAAGSSRSSGSAYRAPPAAGDVNAPPLSASNRVVAAGAELSTAAEQREISADTGAAARGHAARASASDAGVSTRHASVDRMAAVAVAVDSGSPATKASSTRLRTAAPVKDAGSNRTSSNRMLAAAPFRAMGTLKGTELFAAIVQHTGLSELLARSTVESICRRLDLAPADLSPQDVPRVIEGLDRTLHLFLPAEVAKQRLLALSRLGQEP